MVTDEQYFNLAKLLEKCNRYIKQLLDNISLLNTKINNIVKVNSLTNANTNEYYTIIFKDYDGTIISKNIYTLFAKVEIPVITNPLFIGWNETPDIIVVESKEYIALYNTDNTRSDIEYVDLGLTSGTLWANKNLGAQTRTDYGLYFLWGDTQGYPDASSKTFNFAYYKYCNGSQYTMTKYCNSSSYGTVDNKLELELSDDAAYVATQGTYIMPTNTLFLELYNECTWTWTLINGVNGYKVLSKKNSNYIFIPAAGFCDGSSVYYTGSYGYYWSRAVDLSDCFDACYLNFYSSDVDPLYYGSRCYGFSVRPVKYNDTKYTLTLNTNPIGAGYVTGGGEYFVGTSVTINAIPNTGYTFNHWSDGNSTTSNTTTYTMGSTDKTITAYFDAVPVYGKPIVDTTKLSSVIPAFGGEISSATIYYTQEGVTGTLTVDITFDKVTAASLGLTEKNNTLIKSISNLTITVNGKTSDTFTYNIYQAANKKITHETDVRYELETSATTLNSDAGSLDILVIKYYKEYGSYTSGLLWEESSFKTLDVTNSATFTISDTWMTHNSGSTFNYTKNESTESARTLIVSSNYTGTQLLTFTQAKADPKPVDPEPVDPEPETPSVSNVSADFVVNLSSISFESGGGTVNWNVSNITPNTGWNTATFKLSGAIIQGGYTIEFQDVESTISPYSSLISFTSHKTQGTYVQGTGGEQAIWLGSIPQFVSVK